VKTKKLWRYISIVVAVLLVLVAVGTVLGQGPEPPEEDAGPAEGEGDVEAASEMDIVAYPAKTMNYQGYLTDGSGNPLDGTYGMNFSLYDAATGGTREWGPETHNNVQVNDGLFSVGLGETVAMDPYDIFDEQLYLQITINGINLSRQMLRAVPYAMALTAGARVRGATSSSSDYGFYVSNANGPGIRADGQGDDVYGIYNTDITYSDEGYAGPKTYVWVPAQNAVLNRDDVTQAHLEYQDYGEVQVESDVSSGIVNVHIPIQMEQPYGRDYLLRGARIYYKVDSNAFITSAHIRGRDFDTGTALTIGSDTDDEASTTFDWFFLTPSDYYTITERMAPTNLDIEIDLNGLADTVYLYGVRLELDSDY
jgi:hypothetical protein